MDPNAALRTIENNAASYADRIDAKDALCDWLDNGGFSPAAATFLVKGRDVRAMWRGMAVRRPTEAVR